LAWAILGGMPYYLRTFSDDKSVYENVFDHILNARSGELYNEPRLLLMEELREPRNYFSVLRAIAQGNTRLNEIAQSSGVGSANQVSRYIDALQQMKLVTRRVPATESQPSKSKRGLYQIDDHFLRFWFRYVHPNQSALDLGLAEAILESRVKTSLDQFASAAFEEAARDFVARLARKGQLSFLPEQIGGWWEREAEIDVLALNRVEGRALLGECKWSINPLGVDILEELKAKAQKLTRGNNLSRLKFALFARAGFTPALERLARSENVLLFTTEQMIQA
jgi:hypothetical protein